LKSDIYLSIEPERDLTMEVLSNGVFRQRLAGDAPRQ
jgi:hypothetical protein